jgi:hypothetical protein
MIMSIILLDERGADLRRKTTAPPNNRHYIIERASSSEKTGMLSLTEISPEEIST